MVADGVLRPSAEFTEFGRKFWRHGKQGGYRVRERESSGLPQVAKEGRERKMTKISIVLPVVLAVGFLATNLYSARADERLTNTMLGFYPSKAVFMFDTGPLPPAGSAMATHFGGLKKRAEKKFQDAGIEFSGIPQQGTPMVLLTFMVSPVEGFETRSMYFRKLEIQENVVIERVPGRRFYTTTYEIGFGLPMLVDTPTFEQIEKDFDSLVDSFIEDYRIWNRKRDRK